MESKKQQIHDFAVKWYKKFCTKNINYIQLVDHYLADDCEALGFEMCPANANFEKKYGRAVSHTTDFYKQLDEINDIPLLGSGIYSWWRFYNHWAHTGEDILEPENRAWFIIALSHLMTLTGDNPHKFNGTLKKIRIVSQDGYYGTTPPPDEEVQQRLTISDTGTVRFSAYTQTHDKTRSTTVQLSQPDVSKLFSFVSSYFSKDHALYFAQQRGDWIMELVNTDGETFKLRGSLCANYEYEGQNISDYIRALVGLEDMFVLNWSHPDKLLKIHMDYHRVTKIQAQDGPVTWDYGEQLALDRQAQSIELFQQVGTRCKVSHKYEVDGVGSIFEDWEDGSKFFGYVNGNYSDSVELPNETRDYRITLTYKKTPQRVIKESFDKRGLPVGFPDFAQDVLGFIQTYGLGEILDSKFYSKVRRRRSEYIFCSVTFGWSDKSYYYLTDDDSIEVGDKVVVPAGPDNHEAVVEVVDIEYFTSLFTPLPLEQTKKVLRKYVEEVTE